MRKIAWIFWICTWGLAESLDEQILNLENQIKQHGAKPDILSHEGKKPGKNGFFLGVMGAVGAVHHTYEDGLYNAKNNVQGSSHSGVIQNFSTNSTLWMFGGKVGYQNFFNPYFGTRVYGDGVVGIGAVLKGAESIGTASYLLGGLNLDLMGELPLEVFDRKLAGLDVGIYAGFGFGVMMMSDSLNVGMASHVVLPQASPTFSDGAKPMGAAIPEGNIFWKNLLQVDYAINLGAAFTYLQFHRFEIGLKIPLTYLKLGLEAPATYRVQTDKGDREVELNSGDLTFRRTTYVTLSYIYLF